MGCDIHIVVERKLPDTEWLGVWSSDNGPRRNGRASIAQRNYGFFTELAAVRGRTDTSVYPRNIPRDVSRLAWLQYMRAPTDYHSASHMTVKEFTDAWFRANQGDPQHRPEYAAYDILGIDVDGDEDEDYRVVFWFDN